MENDPLAAIDNQLVKWENELEIVRTDDWNDVIKLAKIMVEGYIDWVEETGEDAGMQFEAVEERIEKFVGTFFGYDVYVTGAIDFRGYNDLDVKYLYDTKTVDRFEENPVFQIDDQLQTYDWLTDHQYDVAVHNRMRRVKRTAAARPPFYERKEVVFTRTQRANFERQLRGTVRQMVQAYIELEQNQETDPGIHLEVVEPNPTRDCSWDCPFVAVCPMMNLGEDYEGMIEFTYREKKLYDNE